MSSNLFLILVIAFVVIVLAIACLAIGWLITGKTKIEQPDSEASHKDASETEPHCNSCANPQEKNEIQ